MKNALGSLRYSAISLIAFSLFGLTLTHAQDGHDRHVQIINNTSLTLRSFYASNVDRTGWEEDILGRSSLPPGREVNVRVDDGTGHCLYDFKAVFSDGQHIIRRSVNVCRIERWIVND